jgi:hypothetical protein
MAMTAAGMALAIKTAIAALPVGDTSIPPVFNIGTGKYEVDPANAGTDLDPDASWLAIATGILAEIQANGAAKIGAAVGGLQKDNTGGNPATLAPGTDKFLPIV